MKKAAPVIVVAILGLTLGLMIWWITRTDPVESPPDDGDLHVSVDFKPEEFFEWFDADGDKKVDPTEFSERYGQPPLVFHQDKSERALSAEEAFKRFDRDANGVVDATDLQDFEDKAWVKYKAEAAKKGMQAVTHGDKWLMLNKHQLHTFNSEKGARTRGELPFAGRFWAEKFVANWAVLIDTDGETREGYLSENETRLFLLTGDAKLTVYEPDKVTVSAAAADDPHNLYAAAVRTTRFDDLPANLELAGKCVEWGMPAEARMLYSRVLIFEPTHEEALKALGYTVKDGHYIEGN